MENELPKGWEHYKLREIFTVVKDRIAPNGEALPYIGLEHLSKGGGIKSIGNANGLKSQKTQFKKGDVLYGKLRPYLNKHTLVDFDGVCSTDILAYRAPNNELAKFLNYYFGTASFITYANHNSKGINLPRISPKLISEIEFPLPPQNEQTRIVTKLDVLMEKMDSARTHLDKIPEILKRFRQSVLAQAVSGELTKGWRKKSEQWKSTTIEDLLSNDIKNGLYKPKSYYGSGVKIIRIDGFYDGFIKDFDSLQKVNLTEKEIQQFEISINDILINRVNSIEYLGKCWHVTSLPERCVFESNMMKLSIDTKKIFPAFLRTFLVSHLGLSQLRANAKHAVNQASINQTDVKNVIVPIPSEKEQKEIVRRVESLFALADQIEQQYQSGMSKVKSLPQSILAQAFRGELVPQDPNDEPASVLLERIQKERTKQEVGKKKKKVLSK